MKPSTGMLGLSCAVILLACIGTRLFAKAPAEDAVLQSLKQQRDAFMERVRDTGIPCALPPPHILLTDGTSYGSYDPKRNVLRTPSWPRLKPKARAVFYQLAGPGASEPDVSEVFESEVHRWILVRELGRWWQTCRQADNGRSRYEIEFDADRIAAAYWRDTDPALMERLATRFRAALKGMPVQMPAGETPERYFNEHFDEITASPAYTWFQAFMIASAEAEDPRPSFRETLAEGASRQPASLSR